MFDLSSTYDSLITWIGKNPRLAVDFGPWILMLGGLASLAIIHWPLVVYVKKKLIGLSNVNKVDHASAQSPVPTIPQPKPPRTAIKGRNLFSNTFTNIRISNAEVGIDLDNAVGNIFDEMPFDNVTFIEAPPKDHQV
jgi:hypothetical protein